MRHYISILLIIMIQSLNAKTNYNHDLVTKSTNNIVKRIAKINVLMGSSVYYKETRPPQFDNFEKLKKIASKEELIELTNHPNGVVRCYAFWAISNDKSVDLFPILINHIYDYKVVNTQFGCIGSQEMVGDFFIDIATPRYVDLKSKKIDSIAVLKLDSILIFSNSKLYAKSNALNRAVPTEFLYTRIRELFVKDKNQFALVTLAKYNRQEDIPLILNNREKSELDEDGYFYTYKAIQEYPHPDFIPLLEKNLYKTLDETGYRHEWRELYKAIAAYKNDKSVELLKIPFTQVQQPEIRQYHIDYVYNAIQLNNCEIYDSLLWKMWEEEYRISPDIYNYLMERDSLKGYELTIKSMLQTDEIYSANISLNFNDLGTTENLVAEMLNKILEKDKKIGIRIICENIRNANVHLFSIFTDKIIELKDQVFIEPLFERFEKEWNAHVYLKIAQTLIIYHDDKVNKRIINTKKINDNLNKDWGSNNLDKILKENNLIK